MMYVYCLEICGKFIHIEEGAGGGLTDPGLSAQALLVSRNLATRC